MSASEAQGKGQGRGQERSPARNHVRAFERQRIEAERGLLGALIEYPHLLSSAPSPSTLLSTRNGDALAGVLLSAEATLEDGPLNPADVAARAGLSWEEVSALPVPASSEMAASWVEIASDWCRFGALAEAFHGATTATNGAGGRPGARLASALRDALEEADVSAPPVERTAADAIPAYRELRATSLSRGHGEGGIDTGLGIHRWCGPWSPGQLIVLAARPGEGKSLLGFQAARQLAEQGQRTVYVTKEMGLPDLGLRLANIHYRRPIRERRFARGELEEASEKVREWASLIAYHAASSLTLEAVERLITSAVKRDGAALLVIDNLKNVDQGQRRMERELERLARVTAALKGLAMGLKIPVLALHHLSRSADWSGESPRPKLQWLRGSGEIEEEADTVLMLEKTTPRNAVPDSDGTAVMHVLKARHGEAGHQCPLELPAGSGRFRDALPI